MSSSILIAAVCLTPASAAQDARAGQSSLCASGASTKAVRHAAKTEGTSPRSIGNAGVGVPAKIGAAWKLRSLFLCLLAVLPLSLLPNRETNIPPVRWVMGKLDRLRGGSAGVIVEMPRVAAQ